MCNFIKFTFEKELFWSCKRLVLDEEKQLILRTFGDESAFLSVDNKHLATVIFAPLPKYFFAEVGLGKRIFEGKTVVIDEYVGHFKMLCLIDSGFLEFILDKNVLEDDLFFELQGVKFVLSGNKIKLA